MRNGLLECIVHASLLVCTATYCILENKINNEYANRVLESGTKTDPAVSSDDSGCASGVSPICVKRAITLEEVIELARRKASDDFCEPLLPIKSYFSVATDEAELPVEQPAARVLEMIKVNDLSDDNWAYVSQLMEPDSDPDGKPPSSLDIDNDDDTTLEQIVQYVLSLLFSVHLCRPT